MSFVANQNCSRDFTTMAVAPLVLLLTASVGCDSNPRRGVSGSVTFDGQPVETGRISFRPMAGTSSPGAGSSIAQGAYSVMNEKGVMPGKYRVEIMAWRKTGRKVPALSGEMIDEIQHYVPERYHKNSELTAEVTQGGPNNFDFQLSSKQSK